MPPKKKTLQNSQSAFQTENKADGNNQSIDAQKKPYIQHQNNANNGQTTNKSTSNTKMPNNTSSQSQQQREELQRLKQRIKKFGANPNSELQKLDAFRVMNLNKAPRSLQAQRRINSQKNTIIPEKSPINRQKQILSKYKQENNDQQDEAIKNRMAKFGILSAKNETKNQQQQQDIQLGKQIQKSSSYKHNKPIHKTSHSDSKHWQQSNHRGKNNQYRNKRQH